MVVDIASVADSVPNVKEMSTRRSKARTSKGEVGLSASVATIRLEVSLG